jgi:signal transduction histidine kinase
LRSKSRRRWPPFVALTPMLVIVVGVLAALAIGAVGRHELRAQEDSAITFRSELFAKMLAARAAAMPVEERLSLFERAALRSGAEFVMASEDGTIVVDATRGVGAPERVRRFIAAGRGETTTELGRAHFYARRMPRPWQGHFVVAFVGAPEAPFATSSLIRSVAALTALLVGAAALVAFALARDVYADVRFVRERIVAMARRANEPAGQPIPVRSVDQVGLLTSTFNVLVDRFTAAELAYRQDVSGALAYDRERSAFLAALSHELRTPLNAILGFTEVLLSEVDGPLDAEARENLIVVRGSGQHLRALIDDILDLSALESGELRLNLGEVDIFPIVADVVREGRVGASAKGLVISLVGGSARAFADERRVRQIVGNIVGNAVKYTEHGRVDVLLSATRDTVVVEVADTGPGIAPEEHEAIFQEYWQSREARTRRTGTGLGLAISRRLVEMHGGRIEVTSEIGTGSTFRIVLPVEPPKTEGRGSTRSRPKNPSPEELGAP